MSAEDDLRSLTARWKNAALYSDGLVVDTSVSFARLQLGEQAVPGVGVASDSDYWKNAE